jgi:hypothetical protein
LIACAAPASAAQSAAPPIDSTALAPYAHGNGTVSGSVRFLGGIQAVCAPDIPYVAWYAEKAKRGATALAYDPQMIPYTHLASIRKDRRFTCEGLAPGRYLVWVEGYTQGFPGPIVVSRQKEDSVSGQTSPNYYSESYGTAGSGSEPFVVGPQQVVVPLTGTTNVTL